MNYTDVSEPVETEEDIKLTLKELTRSAKTKGYKINKNKSKYLCITREQQQTYRTRNIWVGEYGFRKKHSFVFLGTEVNNRNAKTFRNVLWQQATCTYVYYYLAAWDQSYLQINQKWDCITTCYNVYACETWPTTVEDEMKLVVLERKCLRRIYVPKMNYVTQWYEIRNMQRLWRTTKHKLSDLSQNIMLSTPRTEV